MAKKTGPAERPASAKDKLTVTVKPFGPSTEELAAIGARIAAASLFCDFVGHAKARLLYVEALDEAVVSKSGKPKPPSRFRATFYDDKNRRAVIAEGALVDIVTGSTRRA